MPESSGPKRRPLGVAVFLSVRTLFTYNSTLYSVLSLPEAKTPGGHLGGSIVSIITKLALAASLATALSGAALAQDLTGKVVGFSQIGSESGWRAAETSVTKQQAETRGIDLKFADAQQKQENQIKAIRGFIAQGVNAILVAPVVATGWEDVLAEAKDASIPVILLDRGVDAPEDLYLTSVASDQVLEGRTAGEWLVKT